MANKVKYVVPKEGEFVTVALATGLAETLPPQGLPADQLNELYVKRLEADDPQYTSLMEIQEVEGGSTALTGAGNTPDEQQSSPQEPDARDTRRPTVRKPS